MTAHTLRRVHAVTTPGFVTFTIPSHDGRFETRIRRRIDDNVVATMTDTKTGRVRRLSVPLFARRVDRVVMEHFLKDPKVEGHYGIPFPPARLPVYPRHPSPDTGRDLVDMMRSFSSQYVTVEDYAKAFAAMSHFLANGYEIATIEDVRKQLELFGMSKLVDI